MSVTCNSGVGNIWNINYFCLKDTFTLLIKPLKLRALLDQVTDWRFGMYVNAVLVYRLKLMLFRSSTYVFHRALVGRRGRDPRLPIVSLKSVGRPLWHLGRPLTVLALFL